MIVRIFFILLAFFSSTGPALASDASQGMFPVREGMARLIIERTKEPLLYRQDAQIALNGRPVGGLAWGNSFRIELAPGTWRVSARARPTAEPSIISVNLIAGTESKVQVELDPSRFSAGGGIAGLSNLLGNSLDAPNDDRLPLFRLRQIVPEIPEGER